MKRCGLGIVEVTDFTYSCRMLLQNARYINEFNRLSFGDIRIEHGVISRIASCLPPSLHEEIFSCDGLILIPALADCHMHTPDTLMRGLFKDMPMSDWCGDSEQGMLQSKVFDYLDTNVESPDFVSLVLHSYLQYVRQGIAFVVENGQADASSLILHACLERIGLKALLDLYDFLPNSLPENDRICLGVHFPEEEDLDRESLENSIAIHGQGNFFIMTHCLETSWRRSLVLEKFGRSSVQVMHENQLLSEKTVLFHCVHVTSEDIDLIKSNGANVVHCPVSNRWSQAGSMPLSKIIGQGINILLGSDFIQHDLWENMRLTYYELKENGLTHLGAQDVFNMASRHAAAIGHQIAYHGVIREGAGADLCFLRNEDCLEPLIETPGFSNTLHNVLFHSRPDMIRHLMVAGSWVMRERKVLTIDEHEVETAYARICKDLFIPQRSESSGIITGSITERVPGT